MRPQNNDVINKDLMEELYDRDSELLKSRFGIDDEEYQRLRDVQHKKLWGMTEREFEKYTARRKRNFSKIYRKMKSRNCCMVLNWKGVKLVSQLAMWRLILKKLFSVG